MKRSRDSEAILISSDSECADLVDAKSEGEDDDEEEDGDGEADDADDNENSDDDDEDVDDDTDDEEDEEDDDNDTSDDDYNDEDDEEETDVDEEDNALRHISESLPVCKGRKGAFSGSTGDRDVESIKKRKRKYASKRRCKQGLKKGGGNVNSKTVSSGEDQKLFAEALNIIRGRDLEMLKLEHCKAYLRHYSLRLTGSKITLLDRVREHVELKACGGMVKYPSSTFTINCTGDACRGDVVLFKQKVKVKIYKKGSRSFKRPFVGRRIVAGRIVKESYGTDKQQHTFTVEVLWSRGPKALPLLYPLLIKGRNLYRLKTLRQRWQNEEERKTVLLEKHSRGDVARNAREDRVLGKRNSGSNQTALSKTEARITSKGKQASQVDASISKPSSFRGNTRSEGTSKETAFRGESMVSGVVSRREYENRFCGIFNSTKRMLRIEARFAGLLIGSQGRNIGAIARASGARVQVCENPLNPTSRLVEIIGMPEQVHVATGMVVKSFLDKGLPPPVVIAV